MPLPLVLLIPLVCCVVLCWVCVSIKNHSDDNFDEFSAETLAAIDNELQQIKLALLQRFPQLDLSSVYPIGQVRRFMWQDDGQRKVPCTFVLFLFSFFSFTQLGSAPTKYIQ